MLKPFLLPSPSLRRHALLTLSWGGEVSPLLSHSPGTTSPGSGEQASRGCSPGPCILWEPTQPVFLSPRTMGCFSWRRVQPGTASVQCCASCCCCVITPSSPSCSVGGPVCKMEGSRVRGCTPRSDSQHWPAEHPLPPCVGSACEMGIIAPPCGKYKDAVPVFWVQTEK